jgi:DNA polymerase-3 subunit gamma/tau
LWPDIVEATKMRRRLAWMHLTQNSQVVSVEGNVLTLGFSNAGARDSFLSGGCDEILRQAAIDVVGADWRIVTLVDPAAQPTPTHVVTGRATGAPAPVEPPAEPERPPAAVAADPEAVASAREAIQQTRPSGGAPAPAATEPEEDGHPDDPDADSQGLDTAELLRRTLGAEVIDEIPHS